MTNTVTFHRGDVRDVMAAMPDASVDLLVTSPPFLALRSYLPADHPDKAKEIGSEATPAAFLDTMLGLTAEWRRLVTPTGSIAVEIGDTYSGGGDYNTSGLRADQPKFVASRRHMTTSGDRHAEHEPHSMAGGAGWPLAKSLCGIPTLYAWSLAYGRNLLTGADSPAGRWRIRNLLTWTRPNPPVGALGDKYRPATSFVTVACASDKRWFDLDAVRTEHKYPDMVDVPVNVQGQTAKSMMQSSGVIANRGNPAGAPPLDWWDHDPDWQPLHRLPTTPYAGTHYAAYPVALPRRLIESMCPRQVCGMCGEPRRRNQGAYTLNSYRFSERPQTRRAVSLADQHGLTNAHIAAIRAFGIRDAGKAIETVNGKNSDEVERLAAEAKAVLGGYFREFVMGTNAVIETICWTDCGHHAYRPGVVFDPFAGSGTTAVAAALCGRDAVLADLDHRNVDLCRRRLTETMLIVSEHTDGDVTTWTVRHDMPGTKHEHPDQLSLFAG